jgi:hypothetical protein
MSFVLSILALFAGLIAVYLSAESRQNNEAKIRKYIDVYANATKKSVDDCVNGISNLTRRIESLESNSADFPEFKHETTVELEAINEKLSNIRKVLIAMETPPFEKNASNVAETNSSS